MATVEISSTSEIDVEKQIRKLEKMGFTVKEISTTSKVEDCSNSVEIIYRAVLHSDVNFVENGLE